MTRTGGPSFGLGSPAEFAASLSGGFPGGRGAAAAARSSPPPLRPRRSPHLLPPPPPLSPRDKPLLPPRGLLKKLSLKEGAETPRPARPAGEPSPPRLRARRLRRLREGRKIEGREGAAPPKSKQRPAPGTHPAPRRPR